MTTKLKKPPKWAKWVARDRSGRRTWFEDRPVWSDVGYCWVGRSRILPIYETDWRESLRPVNAAKPKPKRRKEGGK